MKMVKCLVYRKSFSSAIPPVTTFCLKDFLLLGHLGLHEDLLEVVGN